MSNFPTFYVGTDRCELVTGSDAELVRGSPGWHKRWLDVVRCGAAAKLPTGLRVLRTEHTTGLCYWDVFHVGSDEVISLTLDNGASFDVYPGAAVAFSQNVPDVIAVSPVSGEERGDGTRWPDYPYTGITGSPRNSMSSRFYAAMKAQQGHGWVGVHTAAVEWLEFQRLRAYQNAATDGSFADYKRIVSHVRKLPVWSPQYGDTQQAVWGYDAHHLAVQEEAGIYEISRDPRAYDLASRLVQHVGNYEWYIGGGSKVPFDDNGRVKGWWLAMIARVLRMARHAGDKALVATLEGFAARDVARILEQIGKDGRVTPNRVPPDGRHLKDEWSDSAWQCAILAHGANLLAREIGYVNGADELAAIVLDAIEDHFFRDGVLYADICADGTKPEKWVPYTSGEGTAGWIAQAFIQCGRGDSSVVEWIQSRRKEPVGWEDYL